MDLQVDEAEAAFEAARDCLRRERRRTRDEREAFRAFERRLRDLQPETGATARATPAAQTLSTSASPAGLCAVREAYESTVMAVPHYEDEYGDTYERSVAEEFGPDIAAALTRGTAFEGRHRQLLLSAVADCREDRDRFLQALEAEADSLAATTDRLAPVARELESYDTLLPSELSFGALDAHRCRLDVLEEKCADVAETRQTGLARQRRTLSLPVDVPDVPRYVYRDLPMDYPVLSAVTALLERIEAVRDVVERSLIYDRR